jgi:diadenosine tetraphosphate (Ap4A) HIT family hydrolase
MENECIFCQFKDDKAKILFSTRYFYAVYDSYHVTPNHMLIISKRHVESFDKLSDREQQNLNHCIKKAISHLRWECDYNVNDLDKGYNIGMNSGEAAGQTVMHFHCHVIPRQVGDVVKPRGGVRGVIPHKQQY